MEAAIFLDNRVYTIFGVLRAPILQPMTCFNAAWIFVGMIFIVNDFIWIPYRFAFARPATGRGWWFEQVVTFYFISDIILNFLTGFYDERLQTLVMNPYIIARRYVRGWFAGLQIRGSKFQSLNSNIRELELSNFLGLVLGCIEAKFCK